jgi:hypothetical protein
MAQNKFAELCKKKMIAETQDCRVVPKKKMIAERICMTADNLMALFLHMKIILLDHPDFNPNYSV